MVKWIYKPCTCKTNHFNRINRSGSLRLQGIHQELQWNQRTWRSSENKRRIHDSNSIKLTCFMLWKWYVNSMVQLGSAIPNLRVLQFLMSSCICSKSGQNFGLLRYSHHPNGTGGPWAPLATCVTLKMPWPSRPPLSSSCAINFFENCWNKWKRRHLSYQFKILDFMKVSCSFSGFLRSIHWLIKIAHCCPSVTGSIKDLLTIGFGSPFLVDLVKISLQHLGDRTPTFCKLPLHFYISTVLGATSYILVVPINWV